MTSARSFSTAISRSNLEAQVAAFLYSTGFIHDNEDVTKIEFGKAIFDGLNQKGDGEELIPITISVNRPQTMELIQHKHA